MKFFQMKEDGKKQLNKMKKNKHSTSCCCTLKVQPTNKKRKENNPQVIDESPVTDQSPERPTFFFEKSCHNPFKRKSWE